MKHIRKTTQAAINFLDDMLADTGRKFSIHFPDSDWKHRHCSTESVLQNYQAEGLKICHTHFPCACISAFVTYPSHQEYPTREQIGAALRVALISQMEGAV